MKVSIFDRERGVVIVNYSVNLGVLGAKITENDYTSEAWACALEDGLVKEDEVDRYKFVIVDEI